MAIIDSERNAVVIRIVYDGPPASGKTTSIHALQTTLGSSSEVFSPEQTTDITPYFDWMDYQAGVFQGYAIACQIISVPGQLSIQERRHFLLEKADAVVFVVDASETDKIATAIPYFEDLQVVLNHRQDALPPAQAVIQANKQDLEGALSSAQLADIFSAYPEVKILETSALLSKGVRESFVSAVRLAIARAETLLAVGQLETGKPDAESGQQLLALLKSSVVGGATAAALPDLEQLTETDLDRLNQAELLEAPDTLEGMDDITELDAMTADELDVLSDPAGLDTLDDAALPELTEELPDLAVLESEDNVLPDLAAVEDDMDLSASSALEAVDDFSALEDSEETLPETPEELSDLEALETPEATLPETLDELSELDGLHDTALEEAELSDIGGSSEVITVDEVLPDGVEDFSEMDAALTAELTADELPDAIKEESDLDEALLAVDMANYEEETFNLESALPTERDESPLMAEATPATEDEAILAEPDEPEAVSSELPDPSLDATDLDTLPEITESEETLPNLHETTDDVVTDLNESLPEITADALVSDSAELGEFDNLDAMAADLEDALPEIAADALDSDSAELGEFDNLDAMAADLEDALPEIATDALDSDSAELGELDNLDAMAADLEDTLPEMASDSAELDEFDNLAEELSEQTLSELTEAEPLAGVEQTIALTGGQAIAAPFEAIDNTSLPADEEKTARLLAETAANDTPPSVPPTFPTTMAAPHHVFPPLAGQTMLSTLATEPLTPRWQAELGWQIDLRQWRCFSKTAWQYPTQTEAQTALREQVQIHLQCSPILAEQRYVLIHATEATWRLWQIVRLPDATLATEITQALQLDTPVAVANALFNCAENYTTVWQQWLSYTTSLTLQLDNIGLTPQGQQIYLGVLEQVVNDYDPEQHISDTLLAALKGEFLPIFAATLATHSLDREAVIEELQAIETLGDTYYLVEALSELLLTA